MREQLLVPSTATPRPRKKRTPAEPPVETAAVDIEQLGAEVNLILAAEKIRQDELLKILPF